MTWIKPGLCACFLGAGVVLLASEAAPPAKDPAVAEAALMRAKLASSQKIVEGLMSQNFKLIENGAEELEKICEATQWHAEEDQVYAHYRGELRRTAQKLSRLAEDRDRDGATYTYMHSLTTCINCHDYCRDVLHITRVEPNLQAVPPLQANDEHPSRSIRR